MNDGHRRRHGRSGQDRMPGTPVPLLDRSPDAVVFRLADGAPVTTAAFLRDVAALAARLPDGAAHAANLCGGRYAFAVAFAACLVRGQASLLLSDRSPAGLTGLAAKFPDAYAIADDPACPGLPGLPVLLAVPAPDRLADVKAAAEPPIMPHIPADQVAAVVFTSGSTGIPVAHVKRWGALAARSRAAGERFEVFHAPEQQQQQRQYPAASVVATVPPHHMYGFETTVLLPLHAPAASWCGPSFYPGDVRAALAAVPAPRLLVTTPLHMRALLDGGTGGNAPLPLPAALAAVVSATAPLDAALAAEAEARWGGAPVLEIFGATEVGSIASRRTLDGETWRLYPGVRLHATDVAAWVEAPGMEPTVLADTVDLLPDGSGFRLLGRRADVVKLGGRRASLAGLGRMLAGLDGVLDAAFFAPDDLGRRPGARLVAFVVAPGRTADSILAELRTRLDPVFVPRRVIHVDRLPRNEVGKLPRPALAAMLAARQDAPTEEAA